MKKFSNDIGLKIRAILAITAIILIAGTVIYHVSMRKKCLRDYGEYSIAQVIEVGAVVRKRRRVITLKYEAMGRYQIRKISRRMWDRIEVGDKFKVKYCTNDPKISFIDFETRVW